MTNLDFEGEVTNYGVHSLYSYPARFIPQIPEYFIKKYEPDVVCDCFGGSGTTAVVAKRYGCIPIHMDIMPISLALARVKCHEFSRRQFHKGFVLLEEALDSLDLGPLPRKITSEIACRGDREYFFSGTVLQQIAGVRKALLTMSTNHMMKEFFMACAAQVLKRCSNASKRDLGWTRAKHPSPNEDYIGEVRRKSRAARGNFVDYYHNYPEFLNGICPIVIDTKSEWLHQKIDLVVTSPPYGSLNVVNYPDIHRFTHLFYFSKNVPRGTHFIQTMPQLNIYFSRVASHLRKGGHFVVVVAPSNKDDWVLGTIAIMKNLGLSLDNKISRVIASDRKYAARGIKKEWVLDFVK